MGLDIKKALADPAKAAIFAERVATAYLDPAFGSRSKTEIDLLVFDALVRAGAVDPEGPLYDISRAFNITTMRARGLVLNWQLRSTDREADLRSALVRALQRTRFAKDGTLLTFGIESPLLREDISARLKAMGIFADDTFSREIIRLPVDAFVDFLGSVLDEETKEAFRKRLIAGKQLPDTSFKAVATGVIGKIGEKVMGKVAEDLAGVAVDAVGKAVVKPAGERLAALFTGLLEGDVDQAANSVLASEVVV
jgi:hypothetical protein